MKLGFDRRGLARLLILAVAPLMVSLAHADEIHVASSGGFAAAYRALAPGFEARSGHRLVTVWGPSMGATSGAIPQRLERGEPIDVVIMVGAALDKLVRQGQVLDAGHRVLANSNIGVAVPHGAARPDVSSVDGLKQALLNAHSIAYSDSASGEYMSKVLFPRLGIADQIRPKCHMIPAEPVAQVLARGEADLGFQQLSELLPVPGIDVIGELPAEVQKLTSFSAGIVATSRDSEPAQALIDYLSSDEAAPLIRQSGLSPVTAPAAVPSNGN